MRHPQAERPWRSGAAVSRVRSSGDAYTAATFFERGDARAAAASACSTPLSARCSPGARPGQRRAGGRASGRGGPAARAWSRRSSGFGARLAGQLPGVEPNLESTGRGRRRMRPRRAERRMLDGSTATWSPAVPAPGSSRWREQVGAREAARPSATRPTGRGRCPASAIPDARLVDRRPGAGGPRRPTAPAGCSPVTGRATSCSRALYRAGFANQPDQRATATTDSSSTAPTSPRRCGARRRPTSRRPPSATRAGRSSSASWRCSTRCAGVRRARPVRLRGASPRTTRRAAEAAVRPRRRGRRSADGRDAARARTT